MHWMLLFYLIGQNFSISFYMSLSCKQTGTIADNTMFERILQWDPQDLAGYEQLWLHVNSKSSSTVFEPITVRRSSQYEWIWSKLALIRSATVATLVLTQQLKSYVLKDVINRNIYSRLNVRHIIVNLSTLFW